MSTTTATGIAIPAQGPSTGSSTWTSARDAVVSDRPPRPEEAEAVAHVHALVEAWMAGDVPAGEVRRQCTGLDRWTATRFTDPEHRLFRPLMSLLDDLIATDTTGADGMIYATRQGMFTEAMLRWAKAEIGKVGERVRLVFPVREPWDQKPDKDGRTIEAREGVRGRPIYARTPEERARWANTRDEPEPTRRSIFD